MSRGTRKRANLVPKPLVLLLFLGLIVGVTTMVSAAIGGQSVPDSTEAAEIPAQNAQEAAGSSGTNGTIAPEIRRVDDVNGDGTTDFLVSAPTADGGGENAGVAALVFGPADRESVSLADADATFRGEAAGDFAGQAVAASTDLNGDGVDDLVVGAPMADVGGDDAGAIYVIYGHEDIAGDHQLSDADVRLTGTPGDRAGWALATTAEAVPDKAGLLVGAPRAGDAYAGTVSVVSNESLTRADGATLSTVADVELAGSSDGGNLGWALADAGDVTGDGLHDVLVGAPNASSSESAEESDQSGAAYLLSGPVTAETELENATLVLRGESPGDRAGYAVAGAGDLNGDGIGDVVVGAPYRTEAGNGTATGAAYVVYGPAEVRGERSLSTANRTLVGESTTSTVGWRIRHRVEDRACPAVTVVSEETASEGTPGVVYVHSVAETAANGTEGDAVECPQEQAAGSQTPSSESSSANAGAGAVTADSGDGSAGSASDAGAPGTGGGSDATTSSAASGDSTADGSSENTSTTSGSTETESATNESAGTAPESATNASPTESGQAAGAELGIEPIDATIVCEDDKPYFYNPNSVPVQITVDGPDGVETYGVGPGIDIGGPSPPSFRTPNMAPGEYTVTATLQNGTTVPVNGESTYTTTVKECPTSSFETACVDSDTTQVSFAADNLTGRHAVPVTLEVMSPTPADRQTITLDQPRGGVSSTFEVSDAGQVTVVAELQYASGPDRLNGLTVPAGTCDDTAASTATPTPTETTQQQSTPAETTGASPTPTATSTPRPTTTAQATATTTPTETDTRTTTETETQTEMETQSDTLTDTGTETEAAT